MAMKCQMKWLNRWSIKSGLQKCVGKATHPGSCSGEAKSALSQSQTKVVDSLKKREMPLLSPTDMGNAK